MVLTPLIFDLAGDAFVRELDVSKITMRLKEKQDKKGDKDDSDSTFAKLQGGTLDTLQRCLVGLNCVLQGPYLLADYPLVQTYGTSVEGK